VNHRIFERMLRSRGHPPRARSLECRSYSLSKCVSALGADDTGFVLLLLRSLSSSALLCCSSSSSSSSRRRVVRVCVRHMALDSSSLFIVFSLSLSLSHGRHAHSARVVFYEGGAMALECPFRVEAWGFVCGSVCACVRACVRHHAPRSLSVYASRCEWMCAHRVRIYI
jgi:hypothetical protein